MRQLFFLTFLSILFCSKTFGQTTKAINNSNKRFKTLYFNKWGPPRIGYDTSCEDSLQLIYGFKYKMQGDRFDNESIIDRYKRQNKRVEIKMEKRHGKKWREKYETELKKCLESNDTQ